MKLIKRVFIKTNNIKLKEKVFDERIDVLKHQNNLQVVLFVIFENSRKKFLTFKRQKNTELIILKKEAKLQKNRDQNNEIKE